MEHRDLPEILAAYVDQWNSATPGGKDAEYLELPPEQREELLSLLRLAEQVKDALTPVKPSPAYKQKLGLDLAEMARHRMNREVQIGPPSKRREFIIGAAVALAGGVVYLVRTYIQSRSQPAVKQPFQEIGPLQT